MKFSGKEQLHSAESQYVFILKSENSKYVVFFFRLALTEINVAASAPHRFCSTRIDRKKQFGENTGDRDVLPSTRYT